MKRENLLRLLLVLLAGLAAWWFVTSTEWAEVDVPTPAKGEAARNRMFAVEQLARQLGARVEHRTSLQALPPPGARLLLDSRHWTLFPDRAARLRAWVEAGGHLVVTGFMLGDEELEAWVPMQLREARNAGARAGRLPRGVPDAERHCRVLREPGTAGDSLRVCAPGIWRDLQAAPDARVAWSLQGDAGTEALRVAVGRGTVTAAWSYLLANEEAVRAKTDHALAIARALQLEPGATLWVVIEEAREPLLRWLWRHAWIAVLLALAAVAAGLWRSAVRFGPVGVVPPPQRRSMKEQVAGTGAFLQHHGQAALHAAQMRALHETARQRIPGSARMAPAALAQAISRATGLPLGLLERAMQAHLRPPHALATDLELLELARRRLADATPTHPR